ncbi:hypothetical protein Q1695_002227 [Nippostrongylus brasiliensis]|nr:hypothetical protein Q1695_002227 [Nippostrongylus brasiliensis]
MFRLKYNCEAERIAYNRATTCKTRPIPPARRPGWKENYHYLNNVHTTQLDALRSAIKSWTGMLASHGLPSNMIYSRLLARRDAAKILSKMLWGTNRHVGCATVKCKRFYFTSCMYRDHTNTIGQRIYPVAAVCSLCPPELYCDSRNGLCDI